MELMSMVLFCAFVRLPLALGMPSESDLDLQVKFNTISGLNSTAIPDMDQKNFNITFRNVNVTSELYPDDHCKHCSSCMDKVLNVHKNYKHTFDNMYPGVSESQPSTNKYFKRSVPFSFNNTETVEDNKLKSLRVTKYRTAEEKVYAIKVNEINNQISGPNDGKSTCKVYSVKKAYPCETEESKLILMKRKVNKKKVPKQKITSTTTEKSIPPVTSAGFKKRKLREESSHVSESFMPSIEELY